MSDRPRFLLTLEALPSTNGTVESRLKKALKHLAWFRFRCREIQELPEREGESNGREEAPEAKAVRLRA